MAVTTSGRVGIEAVSLASPVLTLEGIAGRPVSNTRRAVRRFFQQRLAVVGLIITSFLIMIALFAPLIAPTSIEAAAERTQLPAMLVPSPIVSRGAPACAPFPPRTCSHDPAPTKTSARPPNTSRL